MVALGASLMAEVDGTNSEMEVIDDRVMKVEDGIFLVGLILMVLADRREGDSQRDGWVCERADESCCISRPDRRESVGQGAEEGGQDRL